MARAKDVLSVGQLIARARAHAGFTRVSLARRLGVTSKTLGRWEARRVLPAHADRARIVEALAAAGPEFVGALRQALGVAGPPAVAAAMDDPLLLLLDS